MGTKKTEIQKQESAITEALILQGDLSRLPPDDKVTYYRGYCERLGLDPFTRPFEILRLNGREVLYLTRAGAQQLNKLHNVSHAIQSRELMPDPGIFQVTARATLPDGRYTESMSAVSVANIKGEAYCNALMKAETKAKRRATLDLLGLGILDETEAQSIQQAEKVEVIVPTVEALAEQDEEDDIEKACRVQYESVSSLLATVQSCQTVKQLNALYTMNQKMVEENGLRESFSLHKKFILGNN